MTPCFSCAAENPEGARFCNQCGLRLGAAPDPPPAAASSGRSGYTPRHLVDRVLRDRAAMVGERKRVTVLFADIKGSTRLAEQAGAEAWHHILDRFFGLLAHAVHHYEGTINQYTGDGVMALFGAPVAHEDHALRAGHAALEMQAAVREFADELRLERGLNLTLRIGLNTGEVIVGRIGDDLRMDYTAQGVTVNLAARLENICEPGQVYLSRATAALVDGIFALRSLGETRVHGLDRPVEVFALQGRGAHASQLERRLAQGGSFFFGREVELARLQSALALAAGGQGRVVGLVGAAGMGKSRLCHEFLAAAMQRGVAVHRAVASPYARHQPMSAPRSLFLSRIGCAGDMNADRIRACIETELPDTVRQRTGAAAFAFEFAGVAKHGELAPGTALSLRDSMIRALAHFLPNAAAPQILLFEDLHYLDPITLDFVRQLAAAVVGTPTLLLLSWRAESGFDDDAPRGDETLHLVPLETAAVTRLANAWLGADGSLAGLSERIAERAGGNPYFVEEAVVALAETGHLEGKPSAYRRVKPIDELPIPDTVHALIASRIDRLPAAQKSLLQTASVIGVDFDPSLLARVADEGEPAAGALDALEGAGFLRRAGSGSRRRFVQPLLREVAYGAQLDASRVRMHARLAQALEQDCGANPAHPSARSIAEHWALAGDWARAGAWNLHAAHWFSARDARLTAEQFTLAVDNLARAPFSHEVRRLRIAARAGLIRVAQFVQLDAAAVDRAYAEARQLAEECGDPLCAAELSISYGNEQLHRGDAERSAALVESGVRTCPDAQRPALVNRFRLAILMSFGALGRVREGLELANAAGGAGWQSGPIDPDNCMSRAFMTMHLAWTGHIRAAQEDLADAIRLTESDGRSASWMHGLRVELAWFSGEVAGVIEEAGRALEQAEAFGSPYFRALALRARGHALSLLGHHEQALAPLTEALPLSARGAGAYQFQAYLLGVLAEACIGLGRFDDARRHAEAGVAAGQAIGVRLWELRAWIARLSLPREVLGEADARAGFARARELVEAMDARGVEPRLDELLAAREQHAGEREACLRRALEGYERIGAVAHARRLRAGMTVAA